MLERPLTIGRLAARSGTPVKTIRYYDEAGILRPSAVTDAGYRLYSEADAARLESIRMLRELGFSIAAIRSMLSGKTEARELIALQLQVVETQTRALARQAAILRSAAASDDAVRVLHLSHAAASLGAAERAAAVDAFFRRVSGVDPGEAGRALRASVISSLPDNLDAEQLEAWLALTALFEDKQLQATIERQRTAFAASKKTTQLTYAGEMQAILAQAVRAEAEGASPNDPEVRALAQRWGRLFAKAAGKPFDAKFKRWFKKFARETNDPRIERFWQLVAVLHGRPAPPPFTKAQALLIEGLSF